MKKRMPEFYIDKSVTYRDVKDAVLYGYTIKRLFITVASNAPVAQSPNSNVCVLSVSDEGVARYKILH